MTGPLISRLLLLALLAATTLGTTAAVWSYGYDQALGPVAARGRSDLALASDRLVAQLRRYREFAVLLADHPALAALHAAPERRAEAERVLLAAADKTGAYRALYAAPDGRILAASDGRRGRIAAAPIVARAAQGALGAELAVLGEDAAGQRLFSFAAPDFGPGGGVRGMLVVSVDLGELEQDWRGDLPTVFFTDAADRVVATNRSELLYWRRDGAAAMVSPRGNRYEAEPLRRAGHLLWHQDFSPYVPRRALYLTEDLPVIGLTGAALVDIAPARRLATLQAAATAALCLFFGALLFLAMERRRTLAAANLRLEERVAERTRELSGANAALRREVTEREEAEAALTRAQAELVQAGKLSALGQMSAGISHELNQPLMAIRSFAENGAAFLERGRTDRAGEALQRIGDMAARMARIIRNLRAFARQEAEPVKRVGVAAAVEQALEMLETRIAQTGAEIDWQRPEITTVVLAGEVRLTQVVVNLVSNALDAMAASPEKRVTIRVLRDPGGRVLLSVRDTGPGIAEPDRIFDPFYTTKEVTGEEGMGLGLSISYGLVQGFGGRLHGATHPEGGAVFTVELDEARAAA
ncbi:sensor histidine kinase [Roseivivax sp. CAU 1761]